MAEQVPRTREAAWTKGTRKLRWRSVRSSCRRHKADDSGSDVCLFLGFFVSLFLRLLFVCLFVCVFHCLFLCLDNRLLDLLVSRV